MDGNSGACLATCSVGLLFCEGASLVSGHYIEQHRTNSKQQDECETEDGPGMLLSTVGFILKAGSFKA